ncbi:AAA domain-containing protein [Microbacterium sp. cf046]|uniref:AAA family ATPase n=1 Tax=Microbacterium sp. cf046 TaxID=1761803 RepID=UPI0008E2795C|nr:AAA family ATPase [Microbacterium sp. cf046]SFS03762.1 AAA domain-containing protein [Microbacterium sp. cf046]
MRIVVSGTHGSGKSTLIGDFAVRHREFAVLADPFELMDAAAEEPDAGMFFAQLRSSAARLLELSDEEAVIAERGPLDFLAYLDALDALRRPTRAPGLVRRGASLTAEAMARVDLVVLLPLTPSAGIELSADEDLELRDAMNDALLELADDPDLVGNAAVVEITGDAEHRLEQLEATIARLTPR